MGVSLASACWSPPLQAFSRAVMPSTDSFGRHSSRLSPLEFRLPVEHDGDGRFAAVHRRAAHQEALSIGADIEVTSAGRGEQGRGSVHGHRAAAGIHLYRCNRIPGSHVEKFLAVTTPDRWGDVHSCFGCLPLAFSQREAAGARTLNAPDIDLEPARLVGAIRDPPSVRRKRRAVFTELRAQQMDWLPLRLDGKQPCFALDSRPLRFAGSDGVKQEAAVRGNAGGVMKSAWLAQQFLFAAAVGGRHGNRLQRRSAAKEDPRSVRRPDGIYSRRMKGQARAHATLEVQDPNVGLWSTGVVHGRAGLVRRQPYLIVGIWLSNGCDLLPLPVEPGEPVGVQIRSRAIRQNSRRDRNYGLRGKGLDMFGQPDRLANQPAPVWIVDLSHQVSVPQKQQLAIGPHRRHVRRQDAVAGLCFGRHIGGAGINAPRAGRTVDEIQEMFAIRQENGKSMQALPPRLVEGSDHFLCAATGGYHAKGSGRIERSQNDDSVPAPGAPAQLHIGVRVESDRPAAGNIDLLDFGAAKAAYDEAQKTAVGRPEWRLRVFRPGQPPPL